jgi:hypothetical protein
MEFIILGLRYISLYNGCINSGENAEVRVINSPGLPLGPRSYCDDMTFGKSLFCASGYAMTNWHEIG